MARAGGAWVRLPKVMLARYGYNELGQLVDKKLHSLNEGASFVQDVAMRYHIRGWLTQVNDPEDPANLNNRRLFGMKLLYEEANGGRFPSGHAQQYNGNIAAQLWRTAHPAHNGAHLRSYAYSYDAMNRLRQGRYHNHGAPASGENYDEALTYDLNGNILSLRRHGLATRAGNTRTYGLIDDLAYRYLDATGAPGNRLQGVADAVAPPQASGLNPLPAGAAAPIDYAYDAAGNLTGDANKGIANTVYNHLN
nr:hypothetical protein [Bernardetiaceae bacterium]